MGWYIINSMYLRSFLRTRFLHVTRPLLVTPLPLSADVTPHNTRPSFPLFPSSALIAFCCRFLKGDDVGSRGPASGQLNVSLCIWTAWELFLLPASFPLHLNGPLLHCELQESRADASFNTWVQSLHTVYTLYNKKSNKSTYFPNRDGVTLQLGSLKCK